MILLVWNPESGNGSGEKMYRRIAGEMENRNIPFYSYRCMTIKDTKQEIRKIIGQQPFKAVAVIGGDGTVNCVLQSVAGTNMPLSIFPAGSGNDICRNFGFTKDPVQFVNGLLSFEVTTIDLLNVNGLYGITIAGVGLDAQITVRANRAFYKKWLNKLKAGQLSYSIAAVLELLRFKPYELTVTIDRKKMDLKRIYLAACGNMKMYGGGLQICPQADPADGRASITILHNANRCYVLLRLFPMLLKGVPIHKKEVFYTDGRSIEISGDRELPFVLDGESYYASAVQIETVPSSLQIVITK